MRKLKSFSDFCKIMKRVYIFNLLLIQVFQVYAQSSIYSFSTSKELTLISGGVSLNLLGAIQSKNASVLNVDDIEKLSRSDLDILDRTATYNYSLSSKEISDKVLVGSLFLPAITLIDPGQQRDLQMRGLMLLEAYLLNAGTTLFVKSLVKRTRPLVYNSEVPLSEKLKKDARMSFFSGHTSFTATSSFFAASLLTSQGQNRNIAPMVWTSAAILPALQGYLRWKAGKHFPTDIFIGYVIGAGIGILIPKIHE